MEIMKGKIALEILEVVAEKSGRMADAVEVLVKSRLALWDFGRVAYEVRKRRTTERRRTEKKFKQWKADAKLRERYRNIIRWLERDGMIKRPIKKGEKWLEITRRGQKYMEQLRKRKKDAFPIPRYAINPSDDLIIVSFDIPEKEARKRQWLRTALKIMRFRMKQESFWIGYAKIPKEFIQDIRRMKIIGCIEIFKVTQKGSLREIPMK